jgi:hemoglobin/transferrin/lactoferrin receptor protein
VFKDQVTMAGICLAAAALPVYAETITTGKTASEGELEKITVTANRLSEPLSKVAPNIGVLSRDDLDRQGTDDLSNMFKTEPGVSVPDETQRRGASGVTIRGISGNRILMTVDGARLPDGYESAGRGFIAGRDWIEPDTLRQVEVIKGPASALFGSDAIGGAVRFQTFDPADFVDAGKPTYFGLKQSYNGADKGWGTTATLAAAGAEVSAMLMLTRRRSHEVENAGTVGGTGPSRTQSNPQTNTIQNVLAKMSLGQTGPHRLTLSAEQYERERDTNLLTDPAWLSAATRSYLSDDKVVRNRIGADYRYRGGGTLAGAQLKIYQQTLDSQDRDTKVTTGSSRYNDNDFNQRLLGLDGQMNWKTGVHDIVAGIEVTRAHTSRLAAATTATSSSTSTRYSKYFPDSTSNRIGIFAQDSIQIGRAVVTPALRYDHYRMKPNPDSIFLATSSTASPGSFSDGAWSPKLGLVLPLGGGVTGFASLNSGFRAPPFDSAFMARTMSYGSIGYKIIQNPNLKSETSRGVDLGLKYAGDKVEAQLATFYNRYHNFIDLQQLGQSGSYTIYQYQNRSQVEIYGAEAKAAWTLVPGLRLTSALAWAYGQDLTNHTPINAVDPLRATLGIEYQQAQWGSNLLWTVAKKKTRIDASAYQFATPGYGVVDIGGWYQAGRHTVLRLGLNNLFDKKYWQWAVVNETYNITSARDLYSAPRRNLTASIEIGF